MTKILVPVDGGKASEEALALAVELSKKDKGKVYAIHVVEVQRVLPLDVPTTRKAEDLLDRVQRFARERGYEVETIIQQSREIGIAIVDEAIERAVDIVIIGLPYKKRFGEFYMGRIAPFVLRNAPCRVWICREPAS